MQPLPVVHWEMGSTPSPWTPEIEPTPLPPDTRHGTYTLAAPTPDMRPTLLLLTSGGHHWKPV